MTRLSDLFWISLVVVMALVGCGGGSGGSGGEESGGPSEQERRAARDQAFRDEAVERVLDRSRISNCTELSCDGDGERSEGEVPRFDSIFAMCTYDCLPVEIDLTEQRFYQVALLWRRTSMTCFVKATYEPFIVAHVTVPCVPTE